MSFIAQPAANLHSPTAIGDVTPNTGAFTTLALGGSVTIGTNNTFDIGASASQWRFAFIGGVTIGGQQIQLGDTPALTRNPGNGAVSLGTNASNIVIASASGLLSWDGVAVGNPALKASGAVLQARTGTDSAFTPIQGKLTTDTNATTGLGAGLLAATTNATMVIYDGSGQAYRVPCIV